MCRRLICLLTFILVLGVAAGVTNADLVAHWPFDEGSGSVAYDTVGNHDGQFVGNPTWISPGEIGAGALGVDSSNYVNCGPGVTVDPDMTVAFWMNANSQAYQRPIAASSGDYSTDPGWIVMLRVDSPPGGVWFRIQGSDAGGWAGGDLQINETLYEANTWVHMAFTFDSGTREINCYINGELRGTNTVADGRTIANTVNDLRFGNSGIGEVYNGMLDDVQIYNHALTEADVQSIMYGVGGFPKASRPYPEDGSLHMETWVSLRWSPGDFAVSHDVYLGDNFDDVNDGLGDTFRGNQDVDSVYFVVGFTGYSYPDGLVPGTTYYWRIDEVNDADPNSPWKGDVWNFTVPSNKAYEPAPANGSKFIDSAVTLSWTAGFGAKLHYIYFGEVYDTVANATGGPLLVFTEYRPDSLESEKTYYWRVDESDGVNMYTGDVWSFTTAKAGGGIRGDYYKGMNFENHVLTRTDPEINFNWGDPGGPDATVGDDNFSCRWTGEVEAAFTETYTFYAAADDGVRLWVDGVQLVNAWVDQGTTEYRRTIDLVAGNTYSVVMEQYENGGGAAAYLRWSSPSTPKQIIPQAALSPPIKASSPSPSNGATGTKMTPILRWDAGDFAVSHEVYFGTDADAVKNATTVSPEYKGVKALGDEIYDPGKLAWFTTYYWRVDEVNSVNPDSPWVGNLWSFTTGDFLVIDDFEDYDAGNNQIWYSWHDGLGYGSPGTDPYFAGNGTGAAVGDETTASYTEESIRHGGSKAMPLAYDNNKQGYSMYSETELKLTAPRNWTEEGVANLSLWFRGYPASTGSFVEGPIGTFTMKASGADIWTVNGAEADEFHFAYKMLTGAGSMIAKVQSLENTNDWAKAGVMIRETLDPDSAHAYMAVTPANGVSFQRRPGTGATSASDNSTTTAEAAPYWVKIDRTISGTFTASSSANGTTWVALGTPQTIAMGANVYIGLALTSHDAALTCQAVFSNVTTTGNVTGQWAHQDIGITSNAAEPLYVAVSNSTGASAVVVNDDPAAANIDTWTEWVIPLQAFADQGINLSNVDRIAIGLGTRGNTSAPGGSGKMYFDNIRLYRTREAAE